MASDRAMRTDLDDPALFDRGDLYRAYWDASVEGLFAVEVRPDGQFLCAGLNASLEAATGLDSRKTRGKPPADYLDARNAENLVSLYRECVAAGEPFTRSLVLELPSGVRVCDVGLVPVRGKTGRIELLLGRAQDITDLESTARENRFTQGLLRDVLSSLSTHLAVLDRSGRIILVNEAWRRFDQERGAGDCHVGANYFESCAWANEAGNAEAGQLLDGLQRVRDGLIRTYSHIYRFGDSSVYQMRAARFARGSDLWLIVTYDDVSEAIEARQQLSTLTERLLDIQEEERRRIALELHDSTSQHLVAVQLGLALLSQGRATDHTLEDMRLELMEAHREIRTLSYLMHPPRLESDQLEATLRQFVDGFQRRTGAKVGLGFEGDIDAMPYRVQRAIFRVVQEALANAHKHASAKRVSVELARGRHGLRVEITDDGRTPELPMVPGLGLPGMEARIERFGGTLSVTPTGSGTTVLALVPAEALTSGDEPA